jgi:ABC-2 type transport system ATP-binding protein
MSVIAATQLSKRYGKRVGIEAVDLKIEEGEIFGFLGPNGAGKTTTIRVLLGFLRADTGEASLFGLDCWRESPKIKEEVGYLPGDMRLYPWLTGRSALQVFGEIRGRDLKKTGEELAERFRLDLELPVHKMSKGNRQKVGLVLALAHRPKLLLLDEPTSGLDPLVQIELSQCLRERAEEGHTVFFSSHTLSEVEQLCHRVAIVRAGIVVADEQLQTLRERARREVTLTYENEDAAKGAELPPFLALSERHTERLICDLTGDAAELVGWAAGQPLEDMTIGHPDLESLFHTYYNDAQEASDDSAETPAPPPSPEAEA